jgi:hypothetical protein
LTRRALFSALASLPFVGRLVHAKPKRAPIIVGYSPANSATFTAAQTKATSCELLNVDDMTDEQYADAVRQASYTFRRWPAPDLASPRALEIQQQERERARRELSWRLADVALAAAGDTLRSFAK